MEKEFDEKSYKGKKIAIFDADITKHTMASVGEKRTIEVTHKPSGKVKPFSNRTEFYGRYNQDKGTYGGWLKDTNDNRIEKGLKEFPIEDFDIVDVQEPEPLPNVLHSIKQHFKGITSYLGCQDYHLFLGEGHTFRQDILLPWDDNKGKRPDGSYRKYKGQRSDTLKAVHLADVDEYLRKYHPTEVVREIETDDRVAMIAWEGHCRYLKTGNREDNPFIVITRDKDHYAVNGWLYNPDIMEKPLYVEGLGELYAEPSGKVKGYGRRFHYLQLISLDQADNIYPKKTPNGKTNRYGEKKAMTELMSCKDDFESWTLIVELYKKWFGEEPIEYTAWDGSIVQETWLTWLQKHNTLYHMQRWKGDNPQVKDILDKLGVKYQRLI